MPTILNKRKPTSDGHVRQGKLGALAIPFLVAAVLAALAINHPTASNWISDAVQAEFVGAIGPSTFDTAPADESPALHAAK